MHVLPEIPQLEPVGGVTQVFPVVQQPFGQDVPSHLHIPPEQRWPTPHIEPFPQAQVPFAAHLLARTGSQAMQVAFAAPQLSSVVGETHLPPLQHPFGQSQTQPVSVQRWPDEQLGPLPHRHSPAEEQLFASVLEQE
jgi:hypothetical protein